MSELEALRASLGPQIVFVPVADLARSAAFYEEVMLLRLAVDQGRVRIYQVPGGGFLGLCQSAEAPIGDDRLILTFVTELVDAWHARLTDHGIATDGPPRETERYRIYHFFARDPDGYRLEVQRFLHPFP